MINILTAALLATTTASADAEHPRTPGNFGLGLGAGTSTAGLSMKYFTTNGTALQGVIGAGYGHHHHDDHVDDFHGGLGAGLDFLFEMPYLAEGEDVTLGWNIGPGVGVWLDDHYAAVAAAGVLGLELGIIPVPLDVVVEYRPRLLLVPDVGFDWFEATGHVRYYF